MERLIKNFKNQRGFSLAEMIIYVVILSAMLAIVIEVVVSIARSQRVIGATRAIENSAALSMERISREIRQADSIDTASSVLNTHPGVLVLRTAVAGGADRVVEFYLSNGQLILEEDDVVIGSLTEKKATTTTLIFRRFATTTSEGIRTELSLESGTSTYYKTETFYSTSLTR